MPKAVFTSSDKSVYQDLREKWYHFPSIYLKRVQATVGNFVIFYQPRRNDGPTSSGGAKSYVAVARVTGLRVDPTTPGHYFADLADYLDFDEAVPFRNGSSYLESALMREDGRTNRGAFGHSVRLLPEQEFETILRLGFVSVDHPCGESLDEDHVDGEVLSIHPLPARPLIEHIVRRRFRDVAFKHQVRAAYHCTCAITGFALVDRQGNPEVEAAHIRPVSADGPDTVRNGIALTGTMHWLFDSGLISITDDFNLIVTPHGLPSELDAWLPANHKLIVPEAPSLRPHISYLAWHRIERFQR